MSEPQAAVWKFKLGPDVTVIDMPAGAVPLRVGVQDLDAYLWALVIAERDSREGMAPIPTKRRAFLSVGTGHRHHPAAFGAYVGTFDYPGGLVFHVFETALPARREDEG